MPDEAPKPIDPGNPQLYSAQGKPVDLSPEDATQALVSGQAGYLKGTRVNIVTPEGMLANVPAEQVGQALQQGHRLATDEEVHADRLQKKYGGLGGMAATAGLGALSGATLGGSDLAISALGGRQYLEEHKEANPYTWMGSQVAGALAPGIATGGAAEGLEAANVAREGAELLEAGNAAKEAGTVAKGLGTAAKVVGAPNRAVSAVSTGIEKGVAKLLGAEEGGSVITGLAKKAIAKGAGAAAEGALYGGANEIDEDVLGDHEINGEKLMAAMGHGALLGLGTAGAIGAAGAIGSKVLGRVAPKLGTMAEEQAARVLNPTKQFTKAADKLPGGFRGVGRRLLDDGLVQAGDTVESVAPRLEKAADEAGVKVTNIYKTLDEAGVEKLSVKEVADAVKSKLLPDLEKLPKTNRGAIGAVKNWLEDLESYAGVRSEEVAKANNINRAAELENTKVGFKQLQDLRTVLGKNTNWKTPALPGVENVENEAKKDIYGILSKLIEDKAESAAGKMGGTLKAELKEANLAYRQLLLADRTAQDSIARAEANRVISPTDYLTGLAGAAVHHGGRALAGGSLGALAGGHEGEGGALAGFATGAFAALAHHAIRTHGNSVAAVVLDRLSALHGIQRAVTHVDNQIERGVSGFFREETRIPPKLKEPLVGEKGEHLADTATKKVLRAAANADQHAATIERAAAPLAPHAPKVMNSFQRAAIRATTYLAQNAPKPRVTPSITPQFDKATVSDSQKADYARVVAAVHDPATVISDLSNGRITRSQVEALRAVYPAIYAEVVERVQERLADLRRPLSYQQKISIATLLGVPADETLDPQFVQAMQGQYAPTSGSKGPGGPPAPKRPLKTDVAKDTELTGGKHGD